MCTPPRTPRQTRREAAASFFISQANSFFKPIITGKPEDEEGRAKTIAESVAQNLYAEFDREERAAEEERLRGEANAIYDRDEPCQPEKIEGHVAAGLRRLEQEQQERNQIPNPFPK